MYLCAVIFYKGKNTEVQGRHDIEVKWYSACKSVVPNSCAFNYCDAMEK